MANRLYLPHGGTLDVNAIQLEGNFVVGSTGAVGTLKGSGITSVTRLSTGVYKVTLEDQYNRYLYGSISFVSPQVSSAINDGSFVAGTMYQIASVGTTNWTAAGLPAGVKPAVGVPFKAASVGGSGSGTVKAIGNSGIVTVEAMGDCNPLLQPGSASSGGGTIIFQCLGATSSGSTVLIPTDPAPASVCAMLFILRNSSVASKGE